MPHQYFYLLFIYLYQNSPENRGMITLGWLVGLGFTALSDSISVFIGQSPREREKEKFKDRGE